MNKETNCENEKQEKTIHFSKISGNLKNCFIAPSTSNELYNVIATTFSTINKNYDKDDKIFEITYKKNKYIISNLEITENYCFAKISTEKEYHDLFELYKTADISYNQFVITSFTFFYIDFNKNVLAYFVKGNLTCVNEILTNAVKNYAHIDEFEINEIFDDNDFKDLKKFGTKKISLKMANSSNLSNCIGNELSWDYGIEDLLINCKVNIKDVNNKKYNNILKNKEKFREKVDSAVITLEDNYEKVIIDIIKNIICIKTTIELTANDIQSSEKIKNILNDNINKFII